jgi:hypothetical protein
LNEYFKGCHELYRAGIVEESAESREICHKAVVILQMKEKIFL